MHVDFEKFVGRNTCVFYYHLWLAEVHNLQNLPVPQLLPDVLRDSINASSESPSDNSNSISRKQGQSSYKNKSGRLTTVIAMALSSFNSKEKMDLLVRKKEDISWGRRRNSWGRLSTLLTRAHSNA